MEAVNQRSLPLFRRILIVLGKTLLFGGLGLVFIIALSLPIGELIPEDQTSAMVSGDMSNTHPWVLNLTYFIVLIGTMAALVIVRRLISKQSLVSAGFGLRKWLPEFGEGWALGVILVTLGYLILLILGMAQSEGLHFIPFTFLGWLLLFLLQPFAEEIIFRGYLMSLFARYFNIPVALIISSFSFAAVHASNDGFSITGFLTISIAGFLFGLLFLKTGQLWLATGMHAAWNFTQGVVFGFPTSGIRTYSITETTTTGPDWLSGGAFGFEGSVLAIVLIIGAIWWYRKSYVQEKLSAVMNLPYKIPPTTTEMNDVLDHNP